MATPSSPRAETSSGGLPPGPDPRRDQVARIDRLVLADFRSYRTASLAAHGQVVVVTGDNGAGKTNLLEALSMLAPGRGLRQAPFVDLARDGGPGGWSVSATLALPDLAAAVGPEHSDKANGGPTNPERPPHDPGADLAGGVTIGTGVLAATPERRQARIGGEAVPVASLGEWVSVLWLTPAMDRILQEGAGERRRFLDRLTLALDPAHARHAARFETAMRERNRLLATDDPADPLWLTALERRMAEHGVAVAHARRGAVAALRPVLVERRFDPPSGAAAGPTLRAEIAVEGWIERLLDEADAETAVFLYARELERGRPRDQAAGRTLTGPHRSDFAVSHAEKRQPAARCSTGEQKALLIGLVLAQSELVAGRRPTGLLLLLDEVAAHLDARRRAMLFDQFRRLSAQVWITGTERDLFASLAGANASFVHVAGGTLTSGA